MKRTKQLKVTHPHLLPVENDATHHACFVMRVTTRPDAIEREVLRRAAFLAAAAQNQAHPFFFPPRPGRLTTDRC